MLSVLNLKTYLSLHPCPDIASIYKTCYINNVLLVIFEKLEITTSLLWDMPHDAVWISKNGFAVQMTSVFCLNRKWYPPTWPPLPSCRTGPPWWAPPSGNGEELRAAHTDTGLLGVSAGETTMMKMRRKRRRKARADSVRREECGDYSEDEDMIHHRHQLWCKWQRWRATGERMCKGRRWKERGTKKAVRNTSEEGKVGARDRISEGRKVRQWDKNYNTSLKSALSAAVNGTGSWSGEDKTDQL